MPSKPVNVKPPKLRHPLRRLLHWYRYRREFEDLSIRLFNEKQAQNVSGHRGDSPDVVEKRKIRIQELTRQIEEIKEKYGYS